MRMIDRVGSGRFEKYLIDVAPTPILTSFERLDDRVLSRMEVLGRVLILRAVATTNMAADHTEPEMYPIIADLQAFFTAPRARGNLLNLG